MQIASKHVLITGVGRRLGRAIAERLAPYHINLTAHFQTSETQAIEVAQKVKSFGGDAITVQADLHSKAQCEQLAATAISKFGPVEILINSASVFYPTPLGSVTENQWDDLMDVNLKGQFFLSQACAMALRAAQKPGVFINLVDVNAVRTLANYTPYVCSKAGLAMLTRNLSRELAPHIRVNAISPGPVLLPENYTEKQKERSIEKTLLKRLGSANDIAHAAVFLIENDYITGQDLAVDGGRSLV